MATKFKRKELKSRHGARAVIHHCYTILSYWWRNEVLTDTALSSLSEIILDTVISYRGSGDVLAISSNGRITSIEIHHRIADVCT